MTTFTERDIRAAEAVVSLHETGRVGADYARVATLADGPSNVRQVTYGAHQATDASNTLDKIVETYVRYVEDGGSLAAEDRQLAETLKSYLPALAANNKSSFVSLAANASFIQALKDAGERPLMQLSQREVFRSSYMDPAIRFCEAAKLRLPLTLAVVYDSMIHGAFKLVRDRVIAARAEETLWTGMYVVTRRNWLKNHSKTILNKCVYRMDTFLDLLINDDLKTVLDGLMEGKLAGETTGGRFAALVAAGRFERDVLRQVFAVGNWSLTTPFTAHGYSVTETDLEA